MHCSLVRVRCILGLAALLCGAATEGRAASASPVVLVDDRGAVVRIERRPGRIVTLAPHLAELSFSAGAGDRVIGVSEFTDWPPEASRLPRVASGGRVDIEKLTMAKPDLVLGWLGGNRQTDLKKIERSGVAVFATRADGLGDVPRLLRVIGAVAGTERTAGEAADAFERQLLAATRARARPISVFYAIWDRPLMTVGHRHWISDMLRRCGALNVMRSGPGTAFTVSLEQVYIADPDAIIIEPSPASWHRWRPRRGLRAVAAGNVVSPDPDRVQRLGPRAIDGLGDLCDALDRTGKAPAARDLGSL